MAHSESKIITVLSVSFNSSFHLNRLFSNLIGKAHQPDKIQFLVVDNTNGEDEELSCSFDESLEIKIIKNDGQNRQRSKSHASALDIGIKNIKTDFTLIVDPDIHVFKNGWDSFCLNPFVQNERLVIGAPYPQWKLGKVHDFPSVVFMFFKTELVQSFGETFYPFPYPIGRLWNSIIRKIVRLGGIANKSRLDRFHFLRSFCGWLEKITGITSPDTGKPIIEQFRFNGFESIAFESPYSSDLIENRYHDLGIIAQDFEIFLYKNEPIMTHMYSSGVFHWKTEKGSDLNHWQSLVSTVEDGLKEKN